MLRLSAREQRCDLVPREIHPPQTADTVEGAIGRDEGFGPCGNRRRGEHGIERSQCLLPLEEPQPPDEVFLARPQQRAQQRDVGAAESRRIGTVSSPCPDVDELLIASTVVVACTVLLSTASTIVRAGSRSS